MLPDKLRLENGPSAQAALCQENDPVLHSAPEQMCILTLPQPPG